MKLTLFLCSCVASLKTLILPTVVGERILFLSYDPLGSPSHKIFYMGIAEALAHRGHRITMVSSYPSPKDVQNVTDVVLSSFEPDSALSSIFDTAGPNYVITDLLFNTSSICVDTLGRKEMQDLKKEKFDLIIISLFFNYCYLAFVHHFKVPFIYVFPAALGSPFSDLMGNIDFPSFVPHKLLGVTFPVTFLQRMQTTALNTLLSASFPLYLKPKMLSLCREKGLCPEDMPSLVEINNNASMAIINSVRALEWPPRPMMPNIIYAGGIHIKPAKQLPEELENWVRGSGDEGFIYFSLGSALKPSVMPEKYRKILINVFGSLKQRVLWKWDEDSIPNLPTNVKLGNWLPQQDILGHPKLRLFITHGGLLSTQESSYNGIPVIGMPVFADQFSNIMEAEREGWGKVMHWKTLKESTFRKLILDTINNKSLNEVSKRRSALMRDTPIPPDQEAAFWVEYVMRHKGAPHIMSPVRMMRWYEVYNLDVWAFITGVALGMFYLFWLLLKFTLHLCFGISKSPKH